MTKETITQVILKAADGKYLTNGETYGKTVILPESANVDEWREITEKAYNKIMEAEKESGE